MQFIHQPLTWAFLLVLAPVLIHLINMMRQQRVKWAAMEFLLQSHKKHRRWVWLKQLLLLLLRMLAVAAVVAMLAKLVTRDQWSFLFGGQTTHHFILLDDSMSMADRDSGGTAFDRAGLALGRIASQLIEQESPQKVTLIRYSQAAKVSGGGEPTADLNATTVDAAFDEVLEEKRRGLMVTQLAVGPGEALELAERLLENVQDERRVVYLVSDFRAINWSKPAEFREALRRIEQGGAEVHLIRCASQQHQNLAIVELSPADGTRAAGVPLQVNVKVKNYGPLPAEQVQVNVSTRSFGGAFSTASPGEAAVEQLPSLVIDQIGPGESVTRQTQVKFATAGQHIVQTELTSDAVDADSRRWCVIDLPSAVPVLVLDGDNQESSAYYLNSVFTPGRVVTGIQPVVQPLTYLRDAADEELDRYDAIYLLNTGRMDTRSVANLRRYVQNGGGLAFFAGPLVEPDFQNELYDEGKGLFPVAIRSAATLPRDENTEAPDVQVKDHPIFRGLIDEGGESRPLARGIRVYQYLKAAENWSPPDDSSIEVLASLRGGDPLVVQRRLGEGRVVAFLTTATPDWNNWALGPSYPVVLLQLHAFLAAPRGDVATRLVGSPIELQLSAAQFRPNVEFLTPSSDPNRFVPIEKTAEKAQPDSPILDFWLGRSAESSGRNGETDRSGIYVADAVTLEGQSEPRRFALNVDATEGNLVLLNSRELTEILEPVRVQLHDANEMDFENTDQGGFDWSLALGVMLVGLLLGEQALAYSASYHAVRPGGTP